MSTDLSSGGDDTLNGGAGNDIVIGGQGLDTVHGNLSEDLLFGNNAAVTLLNGQVQLIVSDLHDLLTQALFRSFNALYDPERVGAALLLDLSAYVEAALEALGEQDESSISAIRQILNLSIGSGSLTIFGGVFET